MPSFKYDSASQKFATAQLNWPLLTVGGLLVSGDYLPSLAHSFVSDIPAGAIIARTGDLTSLAAAKGICAGIVPQVDSLLAGVPVVAFVLYVDTGTDTTSQLLYYSSDGAGFPFNAQGFNYAVAYDQSAGGFFQV